MLNTYHDVTGVEAGNAKDRLSTGYHWDKEKNSYLAIPSYAQPEGQGAGCVFSSVSDYAKWVRALLKRAGPLSEEAHKEMVSGRTIIPYEGNEALPRYGHALYALGLQVETYRGYPLIGHDGSYSGFKASMRYLPDQDWGVVMFGNADDAYSVAQILFHQLMDGVIEVPEEDQTDWAAYWRKCWEDDKEERHKDDPDLLLSESLEPTYVPLEELAGEYVHAGYGTLSLMFTDGKLEADCSDRGMPFKLRFDHLKEASFVVKYKHLLDGSTRKMKADFDIVEGGIVKSVGLPLCDEMKDEFIWFHKRT